MFYHETTYTDTSLVSLRYPSVITPYMYKEIATHYPSIIRARSYFFRPPSTENGKIKKGHLKKCFETTSL